MNERVHCSNCDFASGRTPFHDNFDRLKMRLIHIGSFNPGRSDLSALLPPPNGCPMQHHTGAAHSRAKLG